MRTYCEKLYIGAVLYSYVEDLGSTSNVDVFRYVTSVVNENNYGDEEFNLIHGGDVSNVFVELVNTTKSRQCKPGHERNSAGAPNDVGDNADNGDCFPTKTATVVDETIMDGGVRLESSFHRDKDTK